LVGKVGGKVVISSHKPPSKKEEDFLRQNCATRKEENPTDVGKGMRGQRGSAGKDRERLTPTRGRKIGQGAHGGKVLHTSNVSLGQDPRENY